MTRSTLVSRNLAYFWRTNLAVVLGVATAVAVLAGALLVGASVRASLRDLVVARLGNTGTVLTGTLFFREQLASGLAGAVPMIAIEGVAVNPDGKRRASAVPIYGVDARFWQFHGKPDQTPADREAQLSEALAAELGLKPGDPLLIRLEKPSAIPKESLHGRKEDSTKTIRFRAGKVLDAAALGEFSLKPAQGSVRAVFVPLRRLQRELEQAGKANVILAPDSVDAAALRAQVTLADLGIKVREAGEQTLSIESDSAVVSDALLAAVRNAAGSSAVSGVFSYLANEIRLGERVVPYSLVTAVAPGAIPGLAQPGDVVINDWTARELRAKPGDGVMLRYYLWDETGALLEREAQFRIAAVTPIAGLAADRNLAPEYPGITGAETLGEWDPPFPMDLKKVRPVDEDYWKRYRTTPKAFLALADGQRLWSSRFGKLTSVRVSGAEPQAFAQRLRAGLDPLQLGMTAFRPREAGLDSSRGATDFGEYFTYFSFFLMVSALLLTALFFQLGIEQRLREIGALNAVGFPQGAIRGLFLAEGLVLAGAGTALGLLGGIAYGKLLLYGLTHWWRDAVGTSLLQLHVSAPPLLAGAAGGIVVALLCIVLTLRTLRRASPRLLLTGQRTGSLAVRKDVRRPRWIAIAALLAALGLLAAGFAKQLPDAGAFFGGGSLLLVAALAWQLAALRAPGAGLEGRGVWRLGFRSAGYRPSRSILSIALIASATFLVVALDAFRQTETQALDPKSGTGGYPLLAEAQVPLIFDLNTDAGRESLNLRGDQWKSAQFVSFRLRPGEDASCLNLYEPRNPRILGAPRSFLEQNRFSFAASIRESANPWLLLDGNAPGDAIPVVIDANSAQYVLHKSIGDEIVLNPGTNSTVRLKLVATLRNSVFQSELLMSEANFKRAFPEQQGFRVFLIDARQPDAVAQLEESLEDYGFDAASTAEKLAGFHKVENTYLSTFQALGGLGLLLGTLGLAAVLLRNVLERRRELALLQAVGYREDHLRTLVLSENLFLLASGIGIGALCALVAILPAFLARGGHRPDASLALLLLAVPLAAMAASLAAVRTVTRQPLLASLRAE